MKQLAIEFSANKLAIELVEHMIQDHAPKLPKNSPVTLPRPMFDALCLAALVGLEAIDPKAKDVELQ